MRAVVVAAFGGPEVLQVVDQASPEPGPGELLVEVAVAGVNFRDLLHRTGKFGAVLPFVAGTEGAGLVVRVGESVGGFRPGDRVAWKSGASYADQVVVHASESVVIPEDVSDLQAAAALLQGLTAHFLTTTTFPISPGDVALVHAAAGGVGSLISQMVTRRGGRVIGTVSSPEKEAAARAAGADEVIQYEDAGVDVAAVVREMTDGRGVDVVYDGVAKTTFDASLAACRTRGMLVLYGGSSGAVPPFEIMRLMHSGSIGLSRPSVRDFTAARGEFDARANELFGWIAAGALTLAIDQRDGLGAAAGAQRALESRQSVGKIVLVV